jgi:NAD+ synthase (glutamine-hydrolysing)
MKENSGTIKFFLAQMNVTVGDIQGNTALIIEKIKAAEKTGADIAIFPEMAVTGYPPEDLLMKKRFCAAGISAIKQIAAACGRITAVVGFVNVRDGNLYNSAAVIRDNKISKVYDKINLPNYGVFDEKRYFQPGKKSFVFKAAGARLGISICEDIWVKSPAIYDLKGRMDFLVNISASPYHMSKWKERAGLFKGRAKELNATLLYCNLVGGQDELVFDGHSMVIDNKGRIILHAKQFEGQDVVFELPVKSKVKAQKSKVERGYTPLSLEEEVYEALKLGVRDYVSKNGFKKVVLGLSGGVDSALVAAVAADALGKDNVNLVFMPSKFSSKESLDDAQKLSDNLGIKMKNIGIQEMADVFLEKLSGEFKGTKPDTTEENLQARLRGNINMALSNKFGWLVLTTGNKSEMSTGYATLYGDMAGGFAVIKDVPKTLVYRLVEMRNKKAGYDLIPRNIITKAPTAELRFNQKDSDSLPDYAVLDRIVEDYIENDKTYGDLKGRYDDETLRRVIRMIDINEYKRRQAPPGIKITPKAFGRDRRMPITNKYRE